MGNLHNQIYIQYIQYQNLLRKIHLNIMYKLNLLYNQHSKVNIFYIIPLLLHLVKSNRNSLYHIFIYIHIMLILVHHNIKMNRMYIYRNIHLMYDLLSYYLGNQIYMLLYHSSPIHTNLQDIQMHYYSIYQGNPMDNLMIYCRLYNYFKHYHTQNNQYMEF